MRSIKDDDPDAISVSQVAEEQGGPAGEKTGPRVGDKAFSDETDLKNEDFIFVY